MRVIDLELIAGTLLSGATYPQQQSDITIKVANYGDQFTATHQQPAGADA